MHDAPQRCLSRPTPAKTPDSLVALACNWFTLTMGIVKPLKSGSPMPDERFEEPALGSPPGGEDSAACRRAGVVLLMLLAWRCAHQSSKEQILASAPSDLSRPPTGAASTGDGH